MGEYCILRRNSESLENGTYLVSSAVSHTYSERVLVSLELVLNVWVDDLKQGWSGRVNKVEASEPSGAERNSL